MFFKKKTENNTMLNFNEDKTQLDAGINFRDVTIMKYDNRSITIRQFF